MAAVGGAATRPTSVATAIRRRNSGRVAANIVAAFAVLAVVPVVAQWWRSGRGCDSETKVVKAVAVAVAGTAKVQAAAAAMPMPHAAVAVAVTAKVAAASRVTMSQPYLVFPLFIAICQVEEKT